MCYCMCCWQLMTSVRHWQSVCISTVSATCKTTFYLSLSSIRTTIHQLALHINVKMSAHLQSAVNACICCLSLAWPLQLPCHANGCIPDSVDQWPSASPPHLFDPKLPADLSKWYRSAFTAVSSDCNSVQWNVSVTIYSERHLLCEHLTGRNCLPRQHSKVRYRFTSVSKESAASIIKVALLLLLK